MARWKKRLSKASIEPHSRIDFLKKLCDPNGMNLDRIRERISNGFKPFVLELSSGKRLRVPHPDFISIGRNVVVVIGKDDSITTADALHIVSMEDLPNRAKRRK